jgi:hypothetical protein
MLTFPVRAAATAPPLDPRTALPAWSAASAPIALTWGVAHRGPATEPTVQVNTDGAFLTVLSDKFFRPGVSDRMKADLLDVTYRTPLNGSHRLLSCRSAPGAISRETCRR